jgi:hypothetical protein
MKNPFSQYKKNRTRSRIETLWLSARNLRSRASLIDPSGPVVSLTTTLTRIPIAYLAIEAIGRGDMKPSRLVLWLDEREQDRPLPSHLGRLVSRGLEIRYCEDVGPHTKYYPFVASQTTFDRPLVTADIDVIYPRYWLSELINAYRNDPQHIHCLRAKRIELKTDGVAPYDDWPDCRSTDASARHFATGVSGVVYPPAFQAMLQAAGAAFKATCPRADDVWLHVQALRHGVQVRQIRARPVHFVEVIGTQQSALNRSNVKGGGNDQQIRATYSPDDLQQLRRARSGSTASSP